METLKIFFWRCSGAHIETLKSHPTEASKFVGIGATIFFTALLASLSSAYALFTVFDNIYIATLLGLVWGLMIFNLDRFIVSSMRKSNGKKEWLQAIPRIVLAIIIAIVIAKPLELKIFEKEINAELMVMLNEQRSHLEGEVSQRFTTDIEKLKTSIEALQQEIEVKIKKRDELRMIAQQEADGTGGSMQRNAGPIYKIKKANADKVDEELVALKEKNNALIVERQNAIKILEAKQLSETQNLAISSIDGPAARLAAADRLAQKEASIWLSMFFITMLFIILEISPVMVKLMSPKGPYDNALFLIEYDSDVHTLETKAALHAKIKEDSEPLPSIEKDYIHEQLNLNLNNS